jgi:hypothetical protein
VNLVDVRLFGCEMDMLADLVADIAEEAIVDEVLDYGMFVAIAMIRLVYTMLRQVLRTVATLCSSSYSPRAPCYRTSHCGNSYAPRRRRWLASSSPGRWKVHDSCASAL